MRVVVPGHGAVRRAPLPLGPSVEILVDDQERRRTGGCSPHHSSRWRHA